jgi:acyl carrier protein
MENAIQQKVVSAVRLAAHLPYGDIPLETSLEALVKDSIDEVALLFELEEALGFELPVDALVDMRTLRELIDKIQAFCATAAPQPGKR